MVLDVSFFDQSFESLNSDDFDDRLLDAVVNHWHNCLMDSEERDSISTHWVSHSNSPRRFELDCRDRTLGLQYRGGGGRPDYSSDLDSWNSGSCAKVDMKSSGVAQSFPIIMGGQVARSTVGDLIESNRVMGERPPRHTL